MEGSITRGERISTSAIKERLAVYPRLLRDIANQRKRLEIFEETYGAPPSPSYLGMPRTVSNISAPTANAAERKTELEERVKAKEAKAEEERLYLEKLFEELKDPDERYLMQLKYIDFKKWEDITFEFFGDRTDYFEKEDSLKRRTYRIHGNALAKLAKIYVEVPQSESRFKNEVKRSKRQ